MSVMAIVGSPVRKWTRDRYEAAGQGVRSAEFAGCMVNEELRLARPKSPFPPRTAKIDDFYGGYALYVLLIRKYPDLGRAIRRSRAVVICAA
jgi:hypothetical protein